MIFLHFFELITGMIVTGSVFLPVSFFAYGGCLFFAASVLINCTCRKERESSGDRYMRQKGAMER